MQRVSSRDSRFAFRRFGLQSLRPPESTAQGFRSMVCACLPNSSTDIRSAASCRNCYACVYSAVLVRGLGFVMAEQTQVHGALGRLFLLATGAASGVKTDVPASTGRPTSVASRGIFCDITREIRALHPCSTTTCRIKGSTGGVKWDTPAKP